MLAAVKEGTHLADLLYTHRVRLMRVTEGRALNPLKRLYEEARFDLRARLEGLAQKNRGKSFEAHHNRMMLAQVEEFMGAFSGKMAKHALYATGDAQHLSLEDLAKQVYALEPQFLGAGVPLAVEEASVFEGLIKGARPLIRQRLEEGVGAYSSRAVTKMELALANATLQNKTVDAAVDDLVAANGAFESERWRAERVVRTEMAHAYEYTKHQGMIETEREDVPGLQRQIIAWFDNRTGEDSKLIHGEVRGMDEPFYDPIQKKHYMDPPNRPNDRETVIPFHPDWSMAFGKRMANIAKRTQKDLTPTGARD